MTFYTNAALAGNDILLIEIDDLGKRHCRRISDYKPYLFLETTDPNSEYKTPFDKPVEKLEFEDISEAKRFTDMCVSTQSTKVYGYQLYNYCYINDRYKGEIKYNPDMISVVYIDIEVDSSNGFPNIETANRMVTSITLRKNGKNLVLGLRDFKTDDPDTKYIQCRSEKLLLEYLIHYWCSPEWSPDVITGWYSEFFDVPYIVNRIIRVLGMKYAKLLSPWKYLKPRSVEIGNRVFQSYEIVGISGLDYQQLYKKFSNTPQEQYSLDFVSSQELGRKKVDYKSQGYESLHDLYERNHQLFIEYNIQDTVLVDELNKKLKFIELVFAMTYDAKINYIDAITTVRMWDTIIHNYLLEQNIVIPPPPQRREKTGKIKGAYVKEPVSGYHNWIASFDFESLYPTLIQQYNISPETFIDKINLTADLVVSNNFEKYKEIALEHNATLTGNGCMFRKDKKGFFPALMERFKQRRREYKKLMFDAEMRLESGDTTAANDFARYNAAQWSLKIMINSGYGAIANGFFRWFDIDMAESITISGQMTTRWVEKYINTWLNEFAGTTNYDYVIAADTDSCYFRFDKLYELGLVQGNTTQEIIKSMDEFCEKYLKPKIDEICLELANETNVNKMLLSMNRECLADKGIWTTKKHYILNIHVKEKTYYPHPKQKLMGIDGIKSSTPLVCRKRIKDAINIIINGTNDELRKFNEEFKKEFFELPFENVGKPTGVNEIEKYTDPNTIYAKGTPINSKAAIMFNYWLIKNGLTDKVPLAIEGDKIKYTYLKMPNPFNCTVMANINLLPNYEDIKKYIDYEEQFEKTYLGPLRAITDAIQWDINLTSAYQVTDFFNE